MSGDSKRNDDFAALLDSHSQQDGWVTLRPGDDAEGEIVLIGAEHIFIDYGGKAEGWTEREEFLDESGELTVATGDRVTLKVLEQTRNGLHLGTRLRRMSGSEAAGWNSLEDAFESEVSIDGTVTGTNKGGFEVSMAGVRAFCPISQIDTEYCETPEDFVEKTLTFRITEFDRDDKRVVVSRRMHLQAEKDKLAEITRQSLAVGDVVKATVRRLKPFGAFVEFGGLDGFIHISELARRRVDEPSEIVTPGDVVEAQVIRIETDDKGKERIGLSLKVLEPDPWVDGLPVEEGDVVEGRVRHIETFGAFIELAPGLDGLLHISEISREHIAHPSDKLKENQRVNVLIKGIDIERRRLLLSMRALEMPKSSADGDDEQSVRTGDVIRRSKSRPTQEPEATQQTDISAESQWAEADAAERMKQTQAQAEGEAPKPKAPPQKTPTVGLITKGIVASIMPYGAFIDLPECGNDARGLCHKSELSAQEGDDPFRNLEEGQELEVEIIRIDEKGRLGLSHRKVVFTRERREVEAVQERLSGQSKMGTLGDIFGKIKLQK